MATDAPAYAQDISNGIFTLLKPAVDQIDAKVHRVRESQVELRRQIEEVTNQLQKISEEQPLDVDFEPYIRRLINTKRRVVLICNIVQNIQERLVRLHRSAEKEISRQKELTEAQRAILEVNTQPTEEATEAEPSSEPSTSGDQ